MRRQLAERGDEHGPGDVAKRWDRVQERLCAEVGETVFNRFLKPISLVGAEAGRVRLGIGTRFMRDFVALNFADSLHRLWQSESPEIIAVDLVTSETARINGAQALDGAAVAATSFDAGLTARGGDYKGPPPSAPAAPPSVSGRERTGLNPELTFEGFVTGPSNALAYEAARRVADGNGLRYNPLYIYGVSGVGKTHLEHAIGNAVLARNPHARVRYLSAEQFLYRYVASIRGNNTMAFKDEYRTADVLLIDDVQFIAGKESTQDEFLHTVNALITENRQLVISGDCAPGELQGIHERVRSRLAGGMVVDIAETDVVIRLGILNARVERLNAMQTKLGHRPVAFAPDVLPFMAEQLVTNARVLNGAFTRVSASADLKGVPVTIDFVRETLKELLHGPERQITLDDIMHKVADYTGIKVADQKSARRTQPIVSARHMSWWLARHLTERSYPQIAQKFGGRDHSTVISGVKRIEDRKARDPRMAADLEALIKLIKG